MTYDQCMVLVIQSHQFLTATVRAFQILFYAHAQLVVRLITRRQLQARQQAPRVCIDDKDGAVKGIEKDVVRGFGSDAVDVQ